MNQDAVIRVTLPFHLQTLAKVGAEVSLSVPPPITLRRVLQCLEQRHPALDGLIIDPSTGRRRPLIRFFACQQDLSHDDQDKLLPEAVRSGREALHIVGAIAGG